MLPLLGAATGAPPLLLPLPRGWHKPNPLKRFSTHSNHSPISGYGQMPPQQGYGQMPPQQQQPQQQPQQPQQQPQSPGFLATPHSWPPAPANSVVPAWTWQHPAAYASAQPTAFAPPPWSGQQTWQPPWVGQQQQQQPWSGGQQQQPWLASGPSPWLGAQPKPETPGSIKRLRQTQAGLEKAYYAPGGDPARSLAQQLGEVEQKLEDRQQKFKRTGL